MKITGDNVDVYVRSTSQSTEKGNRDLHMFARNIIFARIPVYHLVSAIKPHVRLECLVPNMFLLTCDQMGVLRRYSTDIKVP